MVVLSLHAVLYHWRHLCRWRRRRLYLPRRYHELPRRWSGFYHVFCQLAHLLLGSAERGCLGWLYPPVN